MNKEPQKPSKSIDPLIAYWDDKNAVDRAKAIIEQPSHDLMQQPDHNLMLPPDEELTPEEKSRRAFEDPKVLGFINPEDEVTSRRLANKAKEDAEYAESIGKDPNTYVGIKTPGTATEVFNPEEIAQLDASTNEILDKTDQESQKFLAGRQEALGQLPKQEPVETFSEEEIHNKLFDIKPKEKPKPYDQDSEEKAA